MTKSNRSSTLHTSRRGGNRGTSITTDNSGNPDHLGPTSSDFQAENSEESDDDELSVIPKPSIPDSELSPLYWFLLKVVKYIKFGSPTATLLALCGLSRYDFTQTLCQQALENSQAIDVLINVLEADDHKCKVAALRVLQKLVQIQYFQRLLVIKSGISTVVQLLSEPEQDVRCLAAVTLAYAVNNHRSRLLTRKAGAVPLLVDLLDIHGSLPYSSSDDVVLKGDMKQKVQAATAAAKALRSLSYSAAARREMYLAGGIPLLTRLTLSIGNVPRDQLPCTVGLTGSQLHVRHSSVTSNTALSKANAPLLKPKSILVTKRPTTSMHPAETMLDYELVTAVTGVIHQCAADEVFRASVKADFLLSQLMKNMRYECENLQTLCASTIAHFAEDDANRKVMTRQRAPETLVWVLRQNELVQQQQQLQQAAAGNVAITAPTILTTHQYNDDSYSDQQSVQLRVYEEKNSPLNVNIPLLKAVSTAVWKLSALPEACERFRQLGVVQIFIRQLNQSTEEVLLPIVSSISVIGTDQESLSTLQTENAVPRFVWLLSCNHPGLLSAAALTMANLTADPQALKMLESIDAARLLWSLLKHPSSVVQAAAASAIAAFSERSKRSGEVARSLVGGLELLVSLLRAPDLNVVTAAASAVARMATENETLAVLSDHHVVTLLASLVRSKNRDLKLRVAEAIAECCRWPGNPAHLGQGGGVKPLIGYLRSKHLDLRRAAAKALHQVSTDKNNCIMLHKHGAVMLLLRLVGCGDAEIQAAAAGCLCNIRNYILTE